MDEQRAQAFRTLRFGGNTGQAAGFVPDVNPYQPSHEELEQRRAHLRVSNRREALSCTLALGIGYDNADDAIRDAKTIAEWIGLDIGMTLTHGDAPSPMPARSPRS